MTNTEWKSDLYRRANKAYAAGTMQNLTHNECMSKAFDIIVMEAELFIADVLAENEKLKAALTVAGECLSGEPQYHYEGMGCGLEDRNITDRYQAMEHGWECAMGRVYSEHVLGAVEAIDAALKGEGK